MQSNNNVHTNHQDDYSRRRVHNQSLQTDNAHVESFFKDYRDRTGANKPSSTFLHFIEHLSQSYSNRCHVLFICPGHSFRKVNSLKLCKIFLGSKTKGVQFKSWTVLPNFKFKNQNLTPFVRTSASDFKEAHSVR